MPLLPVSFFDCLPSVAHGEGRSLSAGENVMLLGFVSVALSVHGPAVVFISRVRSNFISIDDIRHSNFITVKPGKNGYIWDKGLMAAMES